MFRRLALLGLLSVSACNLEEILEPEPGSPANTGTVKGTLTPFRLQSATSPAAWPEQLKDPAIRRRLSASLTRAVTAQRAARRSALSAEGTPGVDSVPGEVIVRFEEANLSESEALSRVQLSGYRAVYKGAITEYLHLIGYAPLYPGVMRALATEALAQSVQGMRGVRYAEKNARVYAFRTPNDPGYSRQWHYRMMNLPAAWDITTGSTSVAVGIIDSGIVRHPDLNGRVVQGVDLISDVATAGDGDGRDMDATDMGKDQPNGSSSWHGSHVAGTIGAVSNEGAGVAGVTWAGPLVPVRALGKEGGSFADIAAGIQWAVGLPVPGLSTNRNPVQVINMSLGGESPPSQVLQEVIDNAVSKGVIIVVAAGNDNVDASAFSPCNQDNVICVGATRFNGKRASYSNYGADVDVMATGGEVSEDLDGDGKPDGVLSPILDDDNTPVWAYYQGTSMAAPHVAGIVALMKAQNPALTSDEVEQILIATADPASKCGEGCGAGLVNAQAAVLAAKNGLDPSRPSELGVGANQISFLGTSTQSLAVRNLGGGSLKVSVKASGTYASALSFPSGNTVTVSAYRSASLPVAVNTSGLSRGEYPAQLTLTGDNGQSATVAVKIQVGSLEDKDIILAFFFEDAAGELKLEEEGFALVPASSGYSYSMKLTPRTYLAIATIDEDGDEEFFEDGERLGAWRDPANIEPIEVSTGRTVSGINFALTPTESSPD
ncbi:extracellular protease [Cystobacter fuscus DSM 2262]|uniref:Extracellular protease n=1 Tax=Cystobacter fuscus (strain ATCC 25194 / DSM 2262 / NBRC 100088 / M29) TaxID=1242864 RepID=S9QUU0_CYSF2|nr:S8 family peptidase [Cystobacter fuscus]EPX60438.1 extracellular protease [Cystobacter fuscus DSM 2262]